MYFDKIKVLTCSQSLIEYLSDSLAVLYKKDLSEYVNTVVIMPSRRSVKSLKKKILTNNEFSSKLLPKIIAISDLVVNNYEMGIPISYYEQKGLILQTVKKINVSNFNNIISSLNVIEQLIEDYNVYEINISKLDVIVPDNLSNHWQLSLDFIKNFLLLWRDTICKQDLIEPSRYRIENIKNYTKIDITNRIFLAGLDGYIPAIYSLINCIKQYKKGHIILSGYIPDNNTNYSNTHPNYLSSKIDDSKLLLNLNPNTKKEEIIAHIMSDKPFYERQCQDYDLQYLNVIESDTVADEALYIAIIIRKKLEDKTKKISVVTADNQLSIMIKQQLFRWGIVIDCANGKPFNLTCVGKLIINSLDITLPDIDKVKFLSILKNPLLRVYNVSNEKLINILSAIELKWRSNSNVRSCILTKTEQQLIERYTEIINPFLQLQKNDSNSLHNWLTVHIKMCEELCSVDSETKSELWNFDYYTDEKILLSNILQELLKSEKYFPLLTYAEYRSLLIDIMSKENIREPLNHKRLKILSPIQAVYEKFDIVILCGLNEGTWPIQNSSNGLFNRSMSISLGIADPQLLIGRAAFFFASLLHNEEVYISYSLLNNSNPMTPSRWVLKLKAFASFLGKLNQLEPDLALKELKNQLQGVVISKQYQLPKPNPDLKRRPIKLSVSAIEKLFNNPYQIYAQYILKLNCLQDLAFVPDKSLFGTWVHKILEIASIENNYKIQNLQHIALNIMPDISKEQKFLWNNIFDGFVSWISNELIKKTSSSKIIMVEKLLSMNVVLNGINFHIVGKADRIDQLPDGSYEIIDYKTGNIPSKKEVELLQTPQLPLLALLFSKQQKDNNVSKLTYIALKNKKIVSFEASQLIVNIQEKLEKTLSYYTEVNAIYEVNPLHSLTNPYNEFSHLERTQEWINNKL